MLRIAYIVVLLAVAPRLAHAEQRFALVIGSNPGWSALSAGILKGDPSDLSPAERHEWARTRAFGVLAGGNAPAALRLFDQLVREAPDDVVAWRGRGRALTRMAESHRDAGRHGAELHALLDAVKSDPSLTHDPEFQRWYASLTARAQDERDEAARRAEALRADPRGHRRYGLALDFFSARGFFGIDATAVIRGRVFPSVSFDLAVPALDTSVTIVPLRSAWSPFVGIGGHASFSRMLGRTLSDFETSFDMFALHARFEAGVQWVHTSGVVVNLGFGILLYNRLYDHADGRLAVVPFPVLLVGQLF